MMSYRDRKEIQIKLEFPTWDSLSEENKQLLQSKISKGFDLYSDFFDDNEVITLDFRDYELGYGYLCFNSPETDYYLYVNFTTINTQIGIGTWNELEEFVYEEICPVTIKFIIDGHENTDPTIKPIFPIKFDYNNWEIGYASAMILSNKTTEQYPDVLYYPEFNEMAKRGNLIVNQKQSKFLFNTLDDLNPICTYLLRNAPEALKEVYIQHLDRELDEYIRDEHISFNKMSHDDYKIVNGYIVKSSYSGTGESYNSSSEDFYPNNVLLCVFDPTQLESLGIQEIEGNLEINAHNGLDSSAPVLYSLVIDCCSVFMNTNDSFTEETLSNLDISSLTGISDGNSYSTVRTSYGTLCSYYDSSSEYPNYSYFYINGRNLENAYNILGVREILSNNGFVLDTVFDPEEGTMQWMFNYTVSQGVASICTAPSVKAWVIPFVDSPDWSDIY
jgi:hypothetical protein